MTPATPRGRFGEYNYRCAFIALAQRLQLAPRLVRIDHVELSVERLGVRAEVAKHPCSHKRV